MKNTNSTRTLVYRAVLLFCVILLASAVSACRPKDIVSLAKLDKGDLYVGDEFGNAWFVNDPADILSALKKAERVKDKGAAESVDLARASHTIWSGQEKVYYDWESKLAVVVDTKGNKTVFSVDIQELLLGLKGLPPRITVGPGTDPAISASFADISKVDVPSAAVFKSGDKAIVMVAAGKRPTGGYTMSLVNAKRADSAGTVLLTVRLDAPSGGADDVITYPYLELSLERYAEVDVILISTVDGREKMEPLHPVVVEPGQQVVVFRPYRGALLTERAQISGFAAWDLGSFTVTVRDQSSILGSMNVKVTHSLPAGVPEPAWGAFNFYIDRQRAGSQSGVVEFTKGDQVLARIPVSFGGK